MTTPDQMPDQSEEVSVPATLNNAANKIDSLRDMQISRRTAVRGLVALTAVTAAVMLPGEPRKVQFFPKTPEGPAPEKPKIEDILPDDRELHTLKTETLIKKPRLIETTNPEQYGNRTIQSKNEKVPGTDELVWGESKPVNNKLDARKENEPAWGPIMVDLKIQSITPQKQENKDEPINYEIVGTTDEHTIVRFHILGKRGLEAYQNSLKTKDRTTVIVLPDRVKTTYVKGETDPKTKKTDIRATRNIEASLIVPFTVHNNLIGEVPDPVSKHIPQMVTSSIKDGAIEEGTTVVIEKKGESLGIDFTKIEAVYKTAYNVEKWVIYDKYGYPSLQIPGGSKPELEPLLKANIDMRNGRIALIADEFNLTLKKAASSVYDATTQAYIQKKDQQFNLWKVEKHAVTNNTSYRIYPRDPGAKP